MSCWAGGGICARAEGPEGGRWGQCAHRRVRGGDGHTNSHSSADPGRRRPAGVSQGSRARGAALTGTPPGATPVGVDAIVVAAPPPSVVPPSSPPSLLGKILFRGFASARVALKGGRGGCRRVGPAQASPPPRARGMGRDCLLLLYTVSRVPRGGVEGRRRAFGGCVGCKSLPGLRQRGQRTGPDGAVLLLPALLGPHFACLPIFSCRNTQTHMQCKTHAWSSSRTRVLSISENVRVSNPSTHTGT